MQSNHLTILKLILALCLVGFLFSSFQQPQDKTVLQKRIEWCKKYRLVDSLIYYQDLLIIELEKEESKAALVASVEYFLATIMPWEEISISQKRGFLLKYPTSEAWRYAYQAQLYLMADPALDEIEPYINTEDSACLYLNLLEASPENTEALIRTYTLFSIKFSGENINIKKAYSYLQRAESAIQSTQDSVFLYPAQIIVYTKIGYFEEAAYAAHNMVSHLLKSKRADSISLALAYQELANVYLEQLSYKQASIYYEVAISYMPATSNYIHQKARIRYDLAICHFNFENNYVETIFHFRSVFALFAQIEDKPQISELYIDACQWMAQQFVKIKQLDSAQTYVDKAQVFQKKYPYNKGNIWTVQAQIWKQQTNTKYAENAFRKATIEKEIQSGIKATETANQWLLLGKELIDQNKYKEAQKVLNKALWAASIDVESKELPSVESFFVKEQGIKIITSEIEVMLALYNNSKYNISLKYIYNYAQYNLDLLHQLQVENRPQKDFLKISIPVYEQAVEVCILFHSHNKNIDYLHQAFTLAEQSKKLLLEESLQESYSKTFGGVPSELVQLEHRLQDRIAWNKQHYKEALIAKDSVLQDWYQFQEVIFQTNLKTLKQQLAKDYSKYFNFKYRNPITNIDSIQKALADSTALIQYLEGNTAIYQFVICKDTFAVRKIFWRTYKPTIVKYYKHFTDPKLIKYTQSGGYKDFCKTSYELYYKLMHHELLHGVNRLIIIPDGLLSYIPFETLLTKIPLDSVHKISFPSLDFVLKEKSISYNYSSTLWLNQLHINKQLINNKILGIGVTYMDEKIPGFRNKAIRELRGSLDSFTNARRQLDSLAGKYAGDFYTDDYASEYYLKDYAPSYGILHLALHGVIDQRQLENSGLVLAEDGYRAEDNFLGINEIKQLDLNTSMLVLSNCQTGYGRYKRGEGLISLGRSFMYAGSPSLVMTLWAETNASTSKVMNYFYENIKSGMLKDKALQQAKLRYLKSEKGMRAHPAFWAAYIQLGNTDSIEISEPVTHIWWFIIPIAFLTFLGWWSLQALRQRR
jgi:CHAT domain-containing protein